MENTHETTTENTIAPLFSADCPRSKQAAHDESNGSGDGPCPLRDLLSRLGDKWSMLVIISLAQAPNQRLRFSELIKSITGISQRMLTSTLRYLERDGIVLRHHYPEIPPRVEYELTARGKSLLKPVKAMIDWVEATWPDIEKSRGEYDLARSIEL